MVYLIFTMTNTANVTAVSGDVVVVKSVDGTKSLVMNRVDGGWRVEAREPRSFSYYGQALSWATKMVAA